MKTFEAGITSLVQFCMSLNVQCNAEKPKLVQTSFQ
jgi:hypothetical protein